MQKLITFLLFITVSSTLYAQGFGSEDCDPALGVIVYANRSTTSVYSDECITLITTCTTHGGPCDETNPYYTECSTTSFSNGGSGCNGNGGNNDNPYTTTSTYEANCENCTITTVHHTNGDPDDVSTSCTPIPGCTQTNTGCGGDVNAVWSTDCNMCIGGNTGISACPPDPCSVFRTWVNNNIGTLPGTYYDREKKLKIKDLVCTENTLPTCDLEPRYWYYLENGDRYFRYQNDWKQYYECGTPCNPQVLTVTTALTNNVGTLPTATGEQGWCVFASLSKISGSSACTHATSYYANYLMSQGISGCNSAQGVAGGDLASFLSSQTPSPQSNLGPYTTDGCFLIDFFRNNHKILGVLETYVSGQHHAIAVYGVRRTANGNLKLKYYDPEDQTNNNECDATDILGNSGSPFLYN